MFDNILNRITEVFSYIEDAYEMIYFNALKEISDSLVF